MIANKHTPGIVAVVTVLTLCLCLCATAFADSTVSPVEMEYESKLFNTDEVIQINILMDDKDWQEMLASATEETYYACDVEINGERFYNVGIRPKGNTSLSAIASDPNSDRYSFKLEFDQFSDGQTCWGLDKLVLNNNYADATNMKEALLYDMFAFMEADASLYNYASISVNGAYWGVYLALEAVEDSFLQRNYGTQSSSLYKPDGMEMGGDRGEMPERERTAPAEMPEMPAGEMPEMPAEMPEIPAGETPQMPDMGQDGFLGGGGMGGFGMGGGGGANLNYTDDDLNSYTTIWDGAVGDTTEADHRRVVEALQNISAGRSLEQYMDIENLLAYAAVHVFSVNSDSLSGNMAHNYYLLEQDGRLNLLPWDYNLAFGGMGGGSDATQTVNDPIDNAFSGTTFFDTLLADETYHAQYYACLQKLAEEYILGGGFDLFYTRTRSLIDSLVKDDPNAMYTYEEYETAVETLKEVVTLRGLSIDGQVKGTIPSTQQEQTGSDALIDASHLDLSTMGTMNMGGGRGEAGFDPTQRQEDMPRNEAPIQERNTYDTAGQTDLTALLFGGCFLLLIVALVVVLCYKRKPRRK